MTEQEVKKIVADALRPLLDGYEISEVIDKLDPPKPKKTDREVAKDLVANWYDGYAVRSDMVYAIEAALKEARNG